MRLILKINLIQMKQIDIITLKRVMYELNDGKCPLLGVLVDFNKMVVDHEHKLKSEDVSINGKGLVRNAIEFRANSLEGKISSAWRRYFGSDTKKHPCTLSEFLRNLADYLEKGPFIYDNNMYVHPSEVKSKPKLRKSSYNYLKKMSIKCYGNDIKFPEYPKSKKINKILQKWYTKMDTIPEFYE